MWWFVISGVPHAKNQSPKSKTVAYKAYFAANFDFSTKLEVVFKIFENYFRFCWKIEIGRKIGLVGNSFWLRRLIFGMRDPRDNKSSHSVLFEKYIYIWPTYGYFLTYLLLFLDIFGVFPYIFFFWLRTRSIAVWRTCFCYLWNFPFWNLSFSFLLTYFQKVFVHKQRRKVKFNGRISIYV